MKREAFACLAMLSLLSGTSKAASPVFPAHEFEELRSRFLSLYTPIVKEKSGYGLQIHLDTEAKNYFGGVDIRDGKLTIVMGSEFDREPGVTPDLYALILCHEVGHLLGGEPRKVRRRENWVSTEGQSDYYAAAVCLKKVFAEDPSPVTEPVSQRVSELCRSVYAEERDRAICRRTARAGRAMFEYVLTMYDGFPVKPELPEYDRPEGAGISVGYEYPSFQCRLDTFVSGALCAESRDPLADGICDAEEGHVLGVRPACWYPR